MHSVCRAVCMCVPWKMKTIVRLVMPPPRLPQPPAVALASPTIFFENCCVHHTCRERDARWA